MPGPLREVEKQDRDRRKKHKEEGDDNSASDDDRQDSLSLNDNAESIMEDQTSEDEEDKND